MVQLVDLNFSHGWRLFFGLSIRIRNGRAWDLTRLLISNMSGVLKLRARVRRRRRRAWYSFWFWIDNMGIDLGLRAWVRVGKRRAWVTLDLWNNHMGGELRLRYMVRASGEVNNRLSLWIRWMTSRGSGGWSSFASVNSNWRICTGLGLSFFCHVSDLVEEGF